MNILNILSSLAGLAGTIIIFIYGVPNKTNLDALNIRITRRRDEHAEKEVARYKKMSKIGLGMLIFSFLIQLIMGIWNLWLEYGTLFKLLKIYTRISYSIF